MKITDIYTKKKSDQGMVVAIPFTEDQTLTIYGVDGDVFKEGMRCRNVENARILTLPENEWEEAHTKADLVLISKMIRTWSFEEKCTEQNKIKLLQNSPGVFELVNTSVFKRGLFMGD